VHYNVVIVVYRSGITRICDLQKQLMKHETSSIGATLISASLNPNLSIPAKTIGVRTFDELFIDHNIYWFTFVMWIVEQVF
jgi:hypothetical protein